jgi:hypothetical protein
MSRSSKIPCPQCGMPMNFHAEKLDYREGRTKEPAVSGLGGLVEIHTCPNPKCRFIVERPEG